MEGQTGENMMILLERRLDNVIFRMGFGRTRRETRQIVDHKHILVNGKCVNIPSYLVKAGDVIEVKEKAKSAQRYKDVLEVTSGRLIPAWLDVDQENLKGVVKELPTRDETVSYTHLDVYKRQGSNNKTNVVLAVLSGLTELKTPEEFARLRGKSVEEILG